MKLIVNTGSTANDKTGDPLRTAIFKINNNFNELYSYIGSTSGLSNFNLDGGNPGSTYGGSPIIDGGGI